MTTRADPPGVMAVVDSARPVAEALLASGHRVYVVGGLVRDLFLGGGPSSDVDLTTDAAPGQVKEAVARVADDVWSQGERFGTIGCRVGDVDFEITTHRSEAYDASSRKPIVQFSTAIETDLSRRDFTVNAMAIEVPSARLVDPFDGAGDLERSVLRTPIDPEKSFGDDPLRVLRAARFIAGYQLQPTNELVAGAKACADRLGIVSSERVRDEFDKLLTLESPGAGLRFLHSVGAIGRVLAGTHWTDVTVADLATIVDAIGGSGAQRRLARRAAVLWVHVGPTDDRRRAVVAELERLRHSKAEQRSTVSVVDGIEMVVTAHARGPLDPSAGFVRRLYATTGAGWDAMILAIAALVDGQTASALTASMQALAASEPLSDLGPGLTGSQIMGILSLDSGPVIGEAVRYLSDIRLNEGPIDAKLLEDRLLDWHRRRTTA